MKHTTKTTLLALSCAGLFTASAGAETQQDLVETQTCGDIVKECFMHSGAKKANCFYTKSQQHVCETSDLGRLIFKRWSYSNSQPADAVGMALLGPQIMDQECLERFDLSLSTALLSENVPAKYESFSEALDACSRETPQELARP